MNGKTESAFSQLMTSNKAATAAATRQSRVMSVARKQQLLRLQEATTQALPV